MDPRDRAARTRFTSELDRNFSVVAAAGAGKTRAVTDRIAHLAASPEAATALPRLVVVTFTNRAADEMQQRARQQILQAKPSPEVLAAFNRGWFGTIHAWCLKLLTDHGYYLGLPTPLELVADDEDLWNEFVQQTSSVGRSLSTENRRALLRLAPVRHIMELGRCAGSALLRPNECCDCPEIDLDDVYAAAKAYTRKSETIPNSIAQLSAWEKSYRDGNGFVRWPMCLTKAGGIDQAWTTAFAPLRRWVNETALCVAAEVQRDYRNFRLERGVVTYGDQIALADELLQHPEAARRLRQANHIVILDEAQDTDPAQFSVLLEMTRPPDATGRWLETGEHPPRAGSFCMVGDFQQSIYHDRADLAQYRRVHDALVQSDTGDALTFSVTFRLDQQQLDFVNATFAGILHGSEGQVDFVELHPRPKVLPGQVIRISLSRQLLEGAGKLKEHQIARKEADELARWLKEHGPKKLRARTWREVAVLCPRRDWLRTMAAALRRAGLPVEIQSESDLQGDSPAYAWLTALCTIMAEPGNHYEIVGVLREVYGVSDHDLAVFADACGLRFQIETAVMAAGIVSSRLADLTAIRAAISGLPLFSAVDLLIERTALRSRIGTLPKEDFHEPLRDIETLLTLAAEAEASGTTLAEFAERLRSEMEEQRPVRLSAENAIQLITAQKAKGSEWDAVILPFLSRRIIDFSPRYPSIIKVPGTGAFIAALHKEDREEEVKQAFAVLRRQEMERLLYVAVTRARHTLVLALDRELFVPKGRLSDTSQLKFLRGDLGEASAQTLEALAEAAEECAETSASWSEAESAQIPGEHELIALDAAQIESAKRRAQMFPRKHNPSGFDEFSECGADGVRPVWPAAAHSIADTPATLYGTWWHSLFQHFPWRGNSAAWDAAFHATQSASPDPERSAREWPLLRSGTLRDSPLRRFLDLPGVIVHSEFPFLWRMNAQNCMEGVIDFLAVDPRNRCCLLLDWKTNRIRAGDEQQLAAHYLSQLSAYWKAISEITGFNVEAGLHSTSTGKMLLYPNDDLSTRWTKLEKLSADALRAEIELDRP